MSTLSKSRVTSWQKINSRQAGSLLVAEFLHRLYERHSTFVNPIRVSTTVVEFVPWTVTAYTPTREWDMMVRRTGDAFLGDPQTRCGELLASLNRPRARTHELLERLARTDLAGLGDITLADLLISTVFVPLGDIFEINLVQVEAALDDALRRLARRLVPDLSPAELGRAIPALIHSESHTALVREESDFIEFVLSTLDCPPEVVEARISERLAIYPALTAAYGGIPPTAADLTHRYGQYASLGRQQLAQRLEPGGRRATAVLGGAPLLDDEAAVTIAAALRRLGEVRDTNKTLLGRVTVRRNEIVAEIARRRAIDPEQLRLYSLEELCALLVEQVRVAQPVVDLRRARGVTYRREAYFETADGSVADGHAASRAPVVHGLPASAGCHTGRAYVAAGHRELAGMHLGDVLVAEGTDFDLGLLLTLAGAVVTEEGGMLSHAAVVAREKGIPCVIKVEHATRHFATGDLLTVDADAGTVSRVREQITAPAPHPAATAAGSCLVPVEKCSSDQAGNKAAGLAMLGRLGFPVVGPLFVLPVAAVEELAGAQADVRAARLAAIAGEIRGVIGGRLCLRSSGLLEDLGAEVAAAGIYESRVPVEPDAAQIAEALDAVVASGRSARVRAYFGEAANDAAKLAVLVTPYVECSVQGVATYPGPWTEGAAVVEHSERSEETILVEALPSTVDGRVTALDAPGIAAEFARRLSDHWNRDCVELEWGLADGRFVVFQGRRVKALRASTPGT